jgi:ADP-ribosylglycohydrolase
MNPSPKPSQRERILGGLWGSLVGDALGVPVEFKDRPTVQAVPVADMRGHGTHRQPPGTWSDDGALILCTVDSLLHFEFDTEDMGRRFVEWMYRGFWTAWGEPFDVGVTTSDALIRIADGTPAERAGGRDEHSNGNGSLMRILPVVLRFAGKPTDQLASRVERASAITHAHARSKMACVLYGLVVRQLLLGWTPEAALNGARVEFAGWSGPASEWPHFCRLLHDDLVALPEGEIVSTGYVLHTLHASLWSLLTTSTFEACVLKAVNLGGDTDTIGCVAGGLAGVHYGLNDIPQQWIQALARHDDIATLFNRFADTTAPAG